MKINRLLLPLFALLVAGFLLSGCAGLSGVGATQNPTGLPPVQSGGSVTSEGHVVPASSTSLFFTSPGQVSEVRVKAGDRVKKNDVLARLGDREAAIAAVSAAELELAAAQRQSDDLQKQAALAQAKAQLDYDTAEKAYIDAQQKVTDLDTNDYTKRLDDAQDVAIKAKDDLKTAQEDFDKVKGLDVNNDTRKKANDTLKDVQKRYDTAVHDRDRIKNELNLAKSQVAFAKASMDEAARVRDNRKSGPDTADQALADARLKNAKNQLAAAQAALTRLDLVAPYDGTVVKIDLTAGDKIAPNQPVMLIADFSKWFVETSDLNEKDVISLAAGQKAVIVPDALPDLKLSGTVESIAQSFTMKSGDVTYVVRIPLDAPDPRLRWGMTVKVSFGK